MSEIDLILIVLTFIVGFGIAQILDGFSQIARAFPNVKLDVVPVAWALAIFTDQVQFWFGIAHHQSLNDDPNLFWVFLAMAVFLYLAGSLIFPNSIDNSNLDLADDFDDRGRRALLPFALHIATAAVLNYSQVKSVLHPEVYLNALLLGFVLFGYFATRSRARRVAVASYIVILIYGMVAVFARPGG